MKNLYPIYWLLAFILFGIIVIETQNLSLVYNSEKSCKESIQTVRDSYGDYGWYKEKYNELIEKNRGTYIVTYDKMVGQDYGNTERRTITCVNSLSPTMDSRTLHIIGCGQFDGISGFNFIKK